jgi:hypothetical protein
VSTTATATVEIVFHELLLFVGIFFHQVLMFGAIDGVVFHLLYEPRDIDPKVFQDRAHAFTVPVPEPIDHVDQVWIIPYF